MNVVVKSVSDGNNDLKHYGVLGMHWGRRKGGTSTDQIVSRRTSEISKKTGRIDRDINSFKGHEGGIFDKKGRILLTSKEVSSCVNSLKTLKAKKIEKINKKYDERVKSVTAAIMSYASSKDGVTALNGKVVMSKQDVADIVEGLKRLRAEYV